jgi:hypothetical protein
MLFWCHFCVLQIEKGGQFANKYVVVCAREHYVPVAQPTSVFARLMKGLVSNSDVYFSKEVCPAICSINQHCVSTSEWDP